MFIWIDKKINEMLSNLLTRGFDFGPTPQPTVVNYDVHKQEPAPFLFLYQSTRLIGAGETPAVHEVVIRPVNTRLRITCDRKRTQDKAATFIRLGITSHTELPDTFDWRNAADLKTWKAIDSPKQYLTPVQDQ